VARFSAAAAAGGGRGTRTEVDAAAEKAALAKKAAEILGEEKPPHNPYADPDYTPAWYEAHAGKLGFAIVGAIGGWFYKSSVETDNQDAVKNKIMANRPIAPAEMGELKKGNPGVQAVHFARVQRKLQAQQHPGGMVPVAAFTRALAEVLPAACPSGIVDGHHMERLLLALQLHYGALERGAALSGAPGGGGGAAGAEAGAPQGAAAAVAAALGLAGGAASPRREEMLLLHDGSGRRCFAERLPLQLLMVVFTTVVNGPVEDRVAMLFDLMSPSGDPLKKAAIVSLVEHLQLAYQVPANKSVVKVGGKYPAQQYEIGSAEALVEKALAVDVDAIKKVRDLINSDAAHLIELQMFLKATPICAWGECLGQQGMGLKKWKDL
jgi:hypothetical protein